MNKLILLQYPSECHHKNKISVIRGCEKLGILYKSTDNIQDVYNGNCDILWLPMTYVSYDKIPKHVKIIYGPQFFVFSDGHEICGTPDLSLIGRCFFNTLSAWNKNRMEIDSTYIVPMKSYPFGINTDKFCPHTYNTNKIHDILIYYKFRQESDLNEVVKIIQDLNLSYNIIRYGSYHENDYLSLLRNSKMIVWVGGHESQGFALQEALACNIPILVWSVTSMKQECLYGRYTYINDMTHCMTAETATSFDETCGIVCYELCDIKDNIIRIINNLEEYHPREFIMNNLQEDMCLKRMLNELNIQI